MIGYRLVSIFFTSDHTRYPAAPSVITPNTHTSTGHTWNTKNFGYRGYQTPAALGEAIRKLYETQIIPARKNGLAADVYTQLSDVEDEVNGFVTYDRRVVKLPEELMQALACELKGESI